MEKCWHSPTVSLNIQARRGAGLRGGTDLADTPIDMHLIYITMHHPQGYISASEVIHYGAFRPAVSKLTSL